MDQDTEQAITSMQHEIRQQAKQWRGHEDDMAQQITIKLIEAYREQWDPAKSNWRTYVRNRVRFIAIDCARELRILKRKGRKSWANFQSLEALQHIDGARMQNDTYTPEASNEDARLLEFRDIEFQMLQHPELEIALAYYQVGNMKEVGRIFGLSQSRVSQMVSKIASDPLLRQRVETLCDLPSLKECG